MTPQQEAAREGIDLNAANNRLAQILGTRLTPPGPEIVGPFTVPEVPAAVQEAGDQAWAQSVNNVTAAALKEAGAVMPKKRRSDLGKPRPKPACEVCGEPVIFKRGATVSDCRHMVKFGEALIAGPEPAPDQKAGGITGAQAQRIGQLTRGVFEAREGFAAAEDTLRNAEQLLDKYIDSLVIDSLTVRP